MLSKLRAIARYTLLEYVRGRLAAGGIALVLASLALQQLLDNVAITEAGTTQALLGGALARPALVLLLASAVIVSQVREAGDGTRDWLLARDLPRPVWLAGRLAGHALAALALAPLLLVVVAPAAGWQPGLRWACGCALELVLAACMATFLSLTLRQAPLALVGFAGWYLLARSLAALQLIAGAPMLADRTLWIAFARHALALLGVLLPRLDLFAPAAWLEGAGGWAALQLPLVQTAVYASLLVAASVVDLQRSEW